MPDTLTVTTYRFHVLSVQPDPVRCERMNFGVVLFDSDGRATVRLGFEPARLRSLHPDLGHWNAVEHQAQLQGQLDRLADMQQRMAWIGAHEASLSSLWLNSQDDFEVRVSELLDRFVRAPARTRPIVRPEKKGQTKLQVELKNWLKGAKLFSSRIEDISRRRVVQNFPLNIAADLYADLALKNGVVHVMETLDLRGVTRLTPSLRGAAAVKGITLDEARSVLDRSSSRIAVVAASDYGVAKPAISMVQRYATDVYDLGTDKERQRLAQFIGSALQAPDLLAPPFPALRLAASR